MKVIESPQECEEIISLAERLDAPFFFYDLDAFSRRMQRLQEGVKEAKIELFFAMKANPLSPIVKKAAEAAFGIDVASEGELEQAFRCSKNSPLILTGPAKSRKLLLEALEKKVSCFVFESHQQLLELDALAYQKGVRPEALLRLQLNWKENGKNVLGGGGATAFGLPAEEWEKFPFSSLRAVRLCGFHSFQWGNILEIEKLTEIWKRVAEEAKQLSDRLGLPFEILDVGGGLGVPYSEEEGEEPDWKVVVRELSLLCNRYSLQKVWLELGRYAVAPCGSYFCRVIDRKQVDGKALLILEGGINHLLRPALTGSAFPCSLLRESRGELSSFQLHGPLCTALDRLGTVLLPEDVQAGDWLYFQQCGAYGFTEAMPYFLCHQLPAEVVVEKEKIEVIRPPQKARSYLC